MGQPCLPDIEVNSQNFLHISATQHLHAISALGTAMYGGLLQALLTKFTEFQ